MMNSKLIVVVLAALVSVLQYASGQEICNGTRGALGDNRYMQQSRVQRRLAFYLNVADPASCSGLINSFKYCYYVPQDVAPSYSFNFAVYRESSSNSGSYNNISSVFVVERTSSDVMTELDGGGDFACVNFTVNDPVPVNTGDVLGACMFDRSVVNTQQLDIVGIDEDRSSRLLGDLNSGCSLDSLSPTVTSPNRVFDNRLLHLYANIGPELPPTTTSTASTTMGSVPITTTASTTMGSVPVTTERDTVTPPEITAGPTVSSEGTSLSNEPTSMLIDTTADTTGGVAFTTVSDTVLPPEGTTPPTDARPFTNTTGLPVEEADTGVTVAVVVIVLILLIVSGVVVAVIVVLLTKKHRSSKRVYSIRNASGNVIETSQEPDVNVKSNEAYGVSGGVGQSEEMDCEYSVVVTHEAHGAETTEIRPIQGQTSATTVEMTSNATLIGVDRNVAYGTHARASDEPDGFLNMSSNEAYVVSGDVGRPEERENNEYYTIPEQTDGDEYDYVDNHLYT